MQEQEHEEHLNDEYFDIPVWTPTLPQIQEQQKGATSEWQHTCKASICRHDGQIHALAVARNVLFVGSDSRRIRAWKLPECSDAGYLKAGTGVVTAVAAASSTHVFTAHKDFRIRAWATRQSWATKKVATMPTLRDNLLGRRPHAGVITSLAYNGLDGVLHSASRDGTLKTWSIPEFRHVDTVAAHEGAVTAVVVSRDGAVFTASEDYSIKIWRRVAPNGSLILTTVLRFQDSAVTALVLPQNNNNAETTTTIVRSLTTEGGFKSDGVVMYSGAADGFVSCWEGPATSRLRHSGFLHGHSLPVLCLAAVGGFVFSGSQDCTVRVWRREMDHVHSAVSVIGDHVGAVTCVAACAFSGGFHVYTGGRDGALKAWVLYPLRSNSWHSADREEIEREVFGRKSTPRRLSMSSPLREKGIIPALSTSWVRSRLNSNKSSRHLH